jgi:CubicO group peptidase (beta-lactamase class C family)
MKFLRSVFHMSKQPAASSNEINPSPKASRWLAAAVAVSLAACGGGGTADDDLSSPLTATEAAQMLTTGTVRYPAALAVRVTTTRIDVKVLGSQQSGGAALRGDESFPMGSMTKSMTATLAGVMVVQERRLSLGSKVLDVLPELDATTRSEYADVTLGDLLAHRGGIFPATTPEQIARLPELTGAPVEQRLQLARWMLQQPSTSTPRTKTEYSNGGYIVAAAMLERVAAQPYEALLQAKIFTPMGLTVGFGTPGAAAGEPWGHAAAGGGRWAAVDPRNPEAQFPAVGNPAGGAKLSAPAFARYLQMHLRAWRGQGGEVLTPATALLLHAVVADGIALGWEAGRDLEGRDIRWHNGSDDASYYGLMAMSIESDVAAGVVVTGLGPSTESDASEATVRMLR